jgi:hypothetical protein
MPGYSAEEEQLIGSRDSLSPCPPPFEERWVVYADVEGFSKRIDDATRRIRLAHLYFDLATSLHWGSRHLRTLGIAAKMHPTLLLNQDPKRYEEGMLALWRERVRIFSDSIFVFLDPHREPSGVSRPSDSLDGRYVPQVAAGLSRLLWDAGLPHRGGIAFGSCFIDFKLNVFLGLPIVSAHTWAGEQEWLGISLEPGSLAAADRDFKTEPFLPACAVPSSHGDVPTRASNCTQAGMFAFAEGDRVVEDSALDGLLTAWNEAEGAKPHVLERYHATARMWLKDFALDAHFRRSDELRVLAGQ